ncbi:MAG TPA: type I-U CRISPR-associated RAMP protein Csb1/Cas7u [Phycisphaerae bacterium]|nr:type I-U CRISPR-associated RAMP protein Csb1/Cas7u [Phycisphaerae bacterium]
MELTAEILKKTVEQDAAIRRVQKLMPVGGPGEKIFPPTYPGERREDPPRHIFEMRRIDVKENGKDINKSVNCVLIDSVQSQANRLEEALLQAIRAERIAMPYLVVDFSEQKGPDGSDVSDLGEVTSLDAPHRVFDAIIRDSELNGVKFTETDQYKQLLLTKPTNALYLFEISPTSLLFGVWNSTGEGGGLGTKFTRNIVSEIIGVNAVEGQKAAVRIDPLGIRASARVVGGALDWVVASGTKGEKSVKPSEVNHSNVISNIINGGVTIEYAQHTAVITCAGLRRLKFPGKTVKDESAGRAVLAAMALVALTQQDQAGYALRSRCNLVCREVAPFEIVHADGSTKEFSITPDEAIDLFNETVRKVRDAGFRWNTDPIRLKPQARLVELVALSRAQALAGQKEDDGAAKNPH